MSFDKVKIHLIGIFFTYKSSTYESSGNVKKKSFHKQNISWFHLLCAD